MAEGLSPSPPHHGVIDRFTAACQADERVVAAFLGGSYASGMADLHSDVDLGIITTDGTHAEFAEGKAEFVRRLGEPLFLEDFGSSRHAFAIFADGTECDLALGREGDFERMHWGPYRVLLDRRGLLAGVIFTGRQPRPDTQVEELRRLIYWFWHEFGHFVKALARGQVWFAQGQLEALRGMCVNLARLKHDFTDPGVGQEPYFKVERDLPAEHLERLRATVGPLELEHLFRAAGVLLEVYRELALDLANAHTLPYPDRLEAIFVERLRRLSMND